MASVRISRSSSSRAASMIDLIAKRRARLPIRLTSMTNSSFWERAHACLPLDSVVPHRQHPGAT